MTRYLKLILLALVFCPSAKAATRTWEMAKLDFGNNLTPHNGHDYGACSFKTPIHVKKRSVLNDGLKLHIDAIGLEVTHYIEEMWEVPPQNALAKGTNGKSYGRWGNPRIFVVVKNAKGEQQATDISNLERDDQKRIYELTERESDCVAKEAAQLFVKNIDKEFRRPVRGPEDTDTAH